MRVGIIIICYNSQIDIDLCVKHFKQLKNLEVCLVNNHSNDSTYETLKEIQEHCTNVSVVNIKKVKSETSAVRAGARFMFNQFNLKYLGYVTNLNEQDLHQSITMISKNQNTILSYYIKPHPKKMIRKTIFQRLFSITELLNKMENNNQLVNHSY